MLRMRADEDTLAYDLAPAKEVESDPEGARSLGRPFLWSMTWQTPLASPSTRLRRFAPRGRTDANGLRRMTICGARCAPVGRGVQGGSRTRCGRGRRHRGDGLFARLQRRPWRSAQQRRLPRARRVDHERRDARHGWRVPCQCVRNPVAPPAPSWSAATV